MICCEERGKLSFLRDSNLLLRRSRYSWVELAPDNWKELRLEIAEKHTFAFLQLGSLSVILQYQQVLISRIPLAIITCASLLCISLTLQFILQFDGLSLKLRLKEAYAQFLDLFVLHRLLQLGSHRAQSHRRRRFLHHSRCTSKGYKRQKHNNRLPLNGIKLFIYYRRLEKITLKAEKS